MVMIMMIESTLNRTTIEWCLGGTLWQFSTLCRRKMQIVVRLLAGHKNVVKTRDAAGLERFSYDL